MIFRLRTQCIFFIILAWCILVRDYLAHVLRNRSLCYQCNLHVILAEVLRSYAISIDGFFVEFFVLPGTIHQCGDKMDGIQDYQPIDNEGHHCAWVSGKSGLALKI